MREGSGLLEQGSGLLEQGLSCYVPMLPNRPSGLASFGAQRPDRVNLLFAFWHPGLKLESIWPGGGYRYEVSKFAAGNQAEHAV